MLTLSDIQADFGIQAVASKCSNTPEFLDLVNSATRRLARRGDWFETVVPIFVCVLQGCVVFPRYVGQVRKLNICRSPIQVNNMWYSFLTGRHGGHGHGDGWSGWGGAGGWGNGGWQGIAGLRGPECGLTQLGQTPVLQDVLGDGRTVRAYPRTPTDEGKLTTIFGTDNNDQPLTTLNPDGTYSLGTQIVNVVPFGSTSTFIRHIDYIVREPTELPVDYYYYNATTNLLEEMAHYDPTETKPSYAKYRLSQWCGSWTGVSTPCCTQSMSGITALIKLKYIPAQAGTDLVLIPNIDALIKEIMSIKAERAGDMNKAKAFELDAIRECQRQLEDESPDDQLAVENNVLGGYTFQNRCF